MQEQHDYPPGSYKDSGPRLGQDRTRHGPDLARMIARSAIAGSRPEDPELAGGREDGGNAGYRSRTNSHTASNAIPALGSHAAVRGSITSLVASVVPRFIRI